MNKHQFNYLEETVRSYHDMIKQVKEIELEIIHSTPTHDDIQAGRTNVRNNSDDTGDRATALVTDRRLCRLKEKVDAVKGAYESLIEEKQELIELYYWGNKRKNLTGIAYDMNIHPRTAYRWRREFINKLARLLGEG